MLPLLSMLCLLGVVLVGLLLMTSAISLEQASVALVRGFVAVILIVWAICIVEGLVTRVLLALPVVIHWFGIVAFVITGLIILTGLIVRFTRRWPNKNKGDNV
jgi:hypothetical protein